MLDQRHLEALLSREKRAFEDSVEHARQERLNEEYIQMRLHQNDEVYGSRKATGHKKKTPTGKLGQIALSKAHG